MKNRVDLFKQSIIKSLFLLSWPLVISNLMQTFYNAVDAYFLGKLGKIEFSAPTIVWPLIFVFISLSIGFAQAGVTLVAQFTGASNKKAARKAAGQTVVISTLLGISLAIIAIIISRHVITLIAGENSKEVINYAVNYFNIIMIGLPFGFIFNSISSILRGWGDSKFTMKLMFISTVVNIILDPIFIFGFWFIPKMGVIGAAWATTIARVVAAVISIEHLFAGKRGFKIGFEDLKPDFSLVKKVFRIGLPSSLSMSITSLGFVVIMRFVSSFGPTVVSAYGVGNRIINFITMISFGIGNSVTTMVGQFLGAGDLKSAEKTVKVAFISNFLIVFSLSTLTFFFGGELTRFFINDQEVIRVGYIFFKYVSFSLPFFTSMSVFINTLVGAGRTELSMIVDITRLWGIRVPLIAIFSSTFGFTGLFFAMIISNVAAMILAYLFVKFSDWKKTIVQKKGGKCDDIY
ncbi:multidrug transporter MATE [Thermosipho affectus]|uniref:Multidrug-efflux transporter n=1 Tax=Thermosipho affectus TaxID=660294 RepID=A0ABX3IK99_9BACT|nr:MULTISPECIES: MATE family efflux transporter [Thermosipho]ANQ53269.1 multidrug transporter MATE [Thermosipho sp. 1070]APT71719.1 multidrug transporter MATE [Thermosipho sp. 1063]ONN27743.1 multidrug transporter MATE [Thermosipho affectus]OOC45234.1 multidrug transporter MATE [Thermosipho sp. 1074]